MGVQWLGRRAATARQARANLDAVSPSWRCLQVACLLLSLLLTPGCGGCKSSDQGLDREAAAKAREKAEAERREKEKLPYEVGLLRVQPNDLDSDRIEVPTVKPGHWTQVTMPALANHGDFSGQLATEPLDLPGVPYQLSSTRPVVLSKGQRKTLDAQFFVPDGYNQQQFFTQLQTRRGAELTRDAHRLTVMPEHQYFFVVLAREPDRYRFVRGLDSVNAPSGQFDLNTRDPHYRVVLPHVKSRTPLPNNPLAWTSIAYLLWDDQDPATLTLAQQAALVDWLHWGGQLLISGPDSLATLRGSFLEPYLPAAAGDKLELTAELLAPLAKLPVQAGNQLNVDKPWAGESLVPAPQAEVLLKAESGLPLVIERQVGRGRVVATPFRLSQRELIAWDGYDAFLNRYLLRRPGRTFWTAEDTLAVRWSQHGNPHDPRLTTRVRFFSRDAETASSAAIIPQPQTPDTVWADPVDGGDEYAVVDEFGLQPVGHSVAAWNDRSEVAQLTRRIAREAMRIEIPRADFVVRMLALYLLVLVPVNWAVFRLIGRVEWAWAAAPVIALIGAVVVVRAAQLDIGFVRATNELGTLELFADHPRGHLTRFTSLYTSLTTNYDLQYNDPSSIAEPFTLGIEQLRGQARTPLVLEHGEHVVLRGLPVLSNSVGIVHAEQMLDLKGTLSVVPDPDHPGQWRLHNGTNVAIRGAGVLQPSGAAWIGDLPAGESRPLVFDLAIGGPEWEQHREESAETAAQATEGVPHLRSLLNFADGERARGEWRLVGWTDQPLEGLTVSPRSAQSRQAIVVVAHLRPGELPPLESDKSSRAHVEAALKTMRVFNGEANRALDADASGTPQPQPAASPPAPRAPAVPPSTATPASPATP